MRILSFIICLLLFISAKGQDTSLLDNLEKLDKGAEIPMDIAEKYFGAKPDYYGTIYPIELDYFKKIENKAIVILTYKDGVGSHSNLTILNQNLEMTGKKYFVSQNSDHDGSSAVSHSTNYSFVNDNLIEIVDSKEVVKDSSKFDPKSNWIKGDEDFWELETVTFDSYRYIRIENDGRITEFKPNSKISQSRKFKQASLKILEKSEITSYSKQDLRLMRNEIFADYGYKFKSEDLRNYFNKFSWYQGKFEDVTSELSEIEKLNIQLILSVEKTK